MIYAQQVPNLSCSLYQRRTELGDLVGISWGVQNLAADTGTAAKTRYDWLTALILAYGAWREHPL